jgi:hypothetical protein
MNRCLTLALLLIASPALGQEDPFAEEVMPQPFDQVVQNGKPFRAIRVPAWLEETIGAGYTLSGMDFKACEAALHSARRANAA